MYKNFQDGDTSVESFKTHKSFSLTDMDSGSGVFGFSANSSSAHLFSSSSAVSSSYYSGSVSADNTPFATYYAIPSWFTINRLYYSKKDEPWNSFGINNVANKKMTLHGSAQILTIPQQFFGEEVKPGSVTITDNGGATTFTLKDDGFGNIYDNANSASFAAGTTGSVGNIFYSHGIVAITDTGSYSVVGSATGSDGFEIDFKATQTYYEYEYNCTVDRGEFNSTTNISIAKDRGGRHTLPSGLPTSFISKFFPPGDNPTNGTGSLSGSYTAASESIDLATGSLFNPYVTSIGLYNDKSELMAIGKLAHPIKNDDELLLNFVVRFDV